ncbi:uncharacterized protein LOC121050092 [Rosa chinensis]|uniref:uncharacterized protein LOC121050092 n=1 Tax=Rosa chinensis TaxID=74649 RepID=UPI001AD8D3BF|nr:uncharacterized protein LOC121050092 [Rosa chinensis]
MVERFLQLLHLALIACIWFWNLFKFLVNARGMQVCCSVALLQASVRVLLYCLETLDAIVVAREGFFSWEVEGVKCACFLRRIHEELRHQKEVFGPRCHHFLSYCIRVYSGYGPPKAGIKRLQIVLFADGRFCI